MASAINEAVTGSWVTPSRKPPAAEMQAGPQLPSTPAQLDFYVNAACAEKTAAAEARAAAAEASAATARWLLAAAALAGAWHWYSTSKRKPGKAR